MMTKTTPRSPTDKFKDAAEKGRRGRLPSPEEEGPPLGEPNISAIGFRARLPLHSRPHRSDKNSTVIYSRVDTTMTGVVYIDFHPAEPEESRNRVVQATIDLYTIKWSTP